MQICELDGVHLQEREGGRREIHKLINFSWKSGNLAFLIRYGVDGEDRECSPLERCEVVNVGDGRT